jgi:hypothetical protein
VHEINDEADYNLHSNHPYFFNPRTNLKPAEGGVPEINKKGRQTIIAASSQDELKANLEKASLIFYRGKRLINTRVVLDALKAPKASLEQIIRRVTAR